MAEGPPPKQGQRREVRGKGHDGTDWDDLGRKETLLAQKHTTHSILKLGGDCVSLPLLPLAPARFLIEAIAQ